MRCRCECIGEGGEAMNGFRTPRIFNSFPQAASPPKRSCTYHNHFAHSTGWHHCQWSPLVQAITLVSRSFLMKLRHYSLYSRPLLDVVSIGSVFWDPAHSYWHRIVQNFWLICLIIHSLLVKKQIDLVCLLLNSVDLSGFSLQNSCPPPPRPPPQYSHCSRPAPDPNPS